MFVKAGIQGRFFQLHKSDIVADLGMEAPTTAEEEDLVLKNLIIAMKGGTARGEDMKMSRWYSFMRQYKVRKRTWWGTVAVLKHWHVFVRKKTLDDLCLDAGIPQELMEARWLSPKGQRANTWSCAWHCAGSAAFTARVATAGRQRALPLGRAFGPVSVTPHLPHRSPAQVAKGPCPSWPRVCQCLCQRP